MNPWCFMHKMGYKGFIREEEGVEYQVQELEVSVHFSMGIFPFSNVTQHETVAERTGNKQSCTSSHTATLHQADGYLLAGSLTTPVWPNTISTTLRYTLDSENNHSTYTNGNKYRNKPLFLIFNLPLVLTNCSSIISVSLNCSLLTNL